MRVDRELAKRERELSRFSRAKKKREPGNHPAKTLSDVNVTTSQPVCSPLALSLIPESDAIFFSLFIWARWKKTATADRKTLAQTLVRRQARENSHQLSWKFWAGLNSMRALENQWKWPRVDESSWPNESKSFNSRQLSLSFGQGLRGLGLSRRQSSEPIKTGSNYM